MKKYADFHTHSTFSDGQNSQEEMVLAAIEKGMYAIGFSCHSPMPFECDWCMQTEDITAYVAEAKRLREKYAGQIEILCGIELDRLSKMPEEKLDYMIRSNHFIKKGEEYLPVDCSATVTEQVVRENYGGNFYAYARDYYELITTFGDAGSCIIGHFDLVTKFNEGGRQFDESDPRYYVHAMEALEVLAAKDVIFEINMGAMFRKLRTEPYPSLPILRRMKELGCRIILSGDSHCTDALCHRFDDALEYVAQAGYTSLEKYPPFINETT